MQQIREKGLGQGMRTFITAEIGINHNGDLELAKKLIDIAAAAGCDAVKFQKRTIEIVYAKEYLDSFRESPWGNTQRAQKEALEFGKEAYDAIDSYCMEKGIAWFASAWDIESQKFLRQYGCKYNKVASAMLAEEGFLEEVAEEGKYTFVATGMASMDEIARAVGIFRHKGCPFELMHCNSVYPMPPEDANLNMIGTLKKEFQCKVGYSGHETGTFVSTCAVAAGASSIERHITLDQSMYGSDQKASMEPYEICRLVKDIRELEKIMGTGEKKLTKAEKEVKKKLRG